MSSAIPMRISAVSGMGKLAGVKVQNGWGWKVALYLGFSSAAAGADLTWQLGRMLDPLWANSARSGVVVGLALALVGAFFILLDLGRWSRFYRAASRPLTAWIARGFLLLLAFDLLGLLQMGGFLTISAGWDRFLSSLTALLALALLLYGGFLLHSARAFVLWRHPLQVALFFNSGLLAGCGLVAFDPQGLMSLSQLQALAMSIVFLATFEGVLLLALVRAVAPAGQASVKALVRGRTSRELWFGAVGLGLAGPALLSLFGLLLGPDLIRIAGLFALVGLLFLRYSVLASAHRPTNVSFGGLGPWGAAR